MYLRLIISEREQDAVKVFKIKGKKSEKYRFRQVFIIVGNVSIIQSNLSRWDRMGLGKHSF